MDAIGSLIDMTALGCVYFAMLAAGVMYSMVILLGGGHGFDMQGDVGFDVAGGLDAAGGIDAGADALGGSVDVVSISPITIAGFVTAFGAFGIISQGMFDASAGMSLVWATIGGVLVGVVSHLAFIYFFIKPQGSSEVTWSDMVGAVGDVITPIPADSVGEIAIEAQGSRVTLTARSATRQAIPKGTLVKISDVIGSMALVDPVTPCESATGHSAGADKA